jgi:hypothetical protein
VTILRIIFASLLALLALLMFSLEVLLLFDSPHERAFTLFKHGAFIALWLSLGATSVYNFRCREYWRSRLTCPRCQHSGSLHLSVLRPFRICLPGWILGGMIGYILFSQSRKSLFSCCVCDHFCVLRSTGACLALGWFLFYVLLNLVAIFKL